MQTTTKLIHSLTTLVLAALAMLAVARPALADEPELSTRVVVLVDASGSYHSRQADAVERAVGLLDDIAAHATERRVHRWEKAPPPPDDRVTIISLDAMPDVLWTGTVTALKAMDRSAWAARFRARGDYATCTDVGAAFRLAARHLEGDPRYVDKYLFAFTDLVDEPPTTSLRRCRRRSWPSLPPDNFPWEALTGVSVTALWVPAEQTLAWRRVLAEHGLESTFAIHAESESGEIAVTPPPRPERPDLDAARAAAAETERLARRERLVENIGSGSRTLGVVVGAIVVLGLVLAVAAVVTRRLRRRAPGHAPVAVRPQVRPTVPMRPPLAVARPGAIRPQPRRPVPPRSNGHA